MKFDPSSPSSLARDRRKKNKYPPMPALSSLSADQNRSKKKRKLSPANNASDMIAPPKNDESGNTNKYNLRYDPDEPMTEEQKAEWRKEQRKARNRASAAASRNKTRARIEELETEVDNLQNMYSAAVRRIAELEAGAGIPPSSLATALPLRATSTSNTVSPPASPPLSPVSATPTVLMPATLECTTEEQNVLATALSPTSPSPSQHDDPTIHGKQHVIETHSQPAVKITGAASMDSIVKRQGDGVGLHLGGGLPGASSYRQHSYEPLLDFHGQGIAYDDETAKTTASSSSSLTSDELSSSNGSSSSTTNEASSSLSDASSDVTDEEEMELESFLLDAFSGFDPREIRETDDIVKVCV